MFRVIAVAILNDNTVHLCQCLRELNVCGRGSGNAMRVYDERMRHLDEHKLHHAICYLNTKLKTMTDSQVAHTNTFYCKFHTNAINYDIIYTLYGKPGSRVVDMSGMLP